ncbi:isochorismatase family protein [Helicobacter muridarum]|nr:isochorismatase family protein [Helicobacter muridarum]
MNKEKALLLVVDIQERLSASMHKDEFALMLKKCNILINGCVALQVPIMQSLQYTKGLGNSVSGLFDSNTKKIDFEKRAFSCCYQDSPFLSYLQENKQISQIIICGMETHVCILQSARDLVSLGYNVIIPDDAVISRDYKNKKNALSLMQSMDITIANVESILFDMLKTSLSPEFKAISSLVK